MIRWQTAVVVGVVMLLLLGVAVSGSLALTRVVRPAPASRQARQPAPEAFEGAAAPNIPTPTATPTLPIAERSTETSVSSVESLTPKSGAVVRVEIHAEVSASGEGKAQAVAMGSQGKAQSEITSSGNAKGLAQANAPACGSCVSGEPRQDVRMNDPVSKGGLAAVNGPAGARLTVTTDYVNLRAGPGPGYAALGMAMRGDTYAIVGRSDDATWWQVMTPEGARWIIYAFVQVTEASGVIATLPAWPTAMPTATLIPLPTATATPAYPFDLVRVARHSEANSVTLYVWVHDAAGKALGGYGVTVTHNGQVAPGVRVRSAGVALGSTRPACPGCVDDDIYNLKEAWDNRVVYPGLALPGVWAVQLVDGAGAPVGEQVRFTLAPNDDHMELFIDYRWKE